MTEEDKNLRRYDGVDEDRTKFEQWENWITSYLQGSTIPKADWANKILTLLTGDAEKLLRKTDREALYKEDCHKEALTKLRDYIQDDQECVFA